MKEIREMYQPQTVRQIFSFLGMTDFSRPWICDFDLKVQLLRDIIKMVDQTKPNAPLT